MLESKIVDKVLGSLSDLREEMVICTQELVRIPSVVGHEADAQDYMETLYRSLDLKVARLEADRESVRRHPAFMDSGRDFRNRPNLIATLPGDSSGRSLIVNGHVDVVSPEPLGAWRFNPWGGEIHGDRIYGRGAGDMKAGLMANFFALKAILQAGVRPAGTVMLQSVVDEEAGGAGGTLACLMAGHAADAFLCTEPHGINVTIAHAGVSHFRVKVQGRPAHGGLSHLGVNAIGKLIPIYHALEDLDRVRGEHLKFPLFEKGSGRSCHVTVGTIRGGDWPSSVPGEAEMECRISFIPGETLGQIRGLVEKTIHDAAARDTWLSEHPPVVDWFGWQTEPWEQEREDPFVKTLKAAAERIAGRKVDFIGRASGLDARFAKYFDVPAACIGPRAGNIHGADEYVEISSVEEVCRIVALTILTWCK